MKTATQATELRVNAARLASFVSSLRLVSSEAPVLAPHLEAMRRQADEWVHQLRSMAVYLENPTPRVRAPSSRPLVRTRVEYH